MADPRVTRRQFVQQTTAATAAAGMVVAASPALAGEVPEEVQRTRSYNSEMEYRRLGKTGLWISAVCLSS